MNAILRAANLCCSTEIRKVWPLFKRRRPLAGLALWALEGVTFPARDGQRLYGDLTRPDQTSHKLVPVIHGPAYARDFWGRNAVLARKSRLGGAQPIPSAQRGRF